MSVGDKCRVCLCPDKSEYLHMESNYVANKKLKLLDCLRQVTHLEIPLTGGPEQQHSMPLSLCLRCSKALQVAYHFIQLAHESEAALRSTFQQPLKEDQEEADNKTGHDIENEGSTVVFETKMPAATPTSNRPQTSSNNNKYNLQFCEYVEKG